MILLDIFEILSPNILNRLIATVPQLFFIFRSTIFEISSVFTVT
jgi:hypothetical protein